MPKAKVTVKTRKQPGEIESILKTLRSRAKAVARETAYAVAQGARERVHVITGELKRSIHVVENPDDSYTVVVGKNYGVFEEYGTRFRPPHPFFRPAVEEQRQKHQERARRMVHR